MNRKLHRAPRRASAYALFLFTAMLVTVIGMSALGVTRIKLQNSERDNHAASARVYAQAGVDFGLLYLYKEKDWRSLIAHDTWQPSETLGLGSYAWKLVDEVNGSFTADNAAPVRVYGHGACGPSVWVYSVLVQPPLTALPNSNLMANGDLETGVASPWVMFLGGTLAVRTDSPHGGAAYGHVSGRFTSLPFPYHEVTGALENGTTYTAQAWVRMASKAEEVVLKISLSSSGSGIKEFELGRATVGTSWTQISGAATPAWEGTLSSGSVVIATATGQDFSFDDVVLRKKTNVTVGPIAGTWRREAD